METLAVVEANPVQRLVLGVLVAGEAASTSSLFKVATHASTIAPELDEDFEVPDFVPEEWGGPGGEEPQLNVYAP